jgi:hypothetical protein
MHERMKIEDGKLIHQRTMDAQPNLDRVQLLKEAPLNPIEDGWLVGSVPLLLVTEWLKEAGVKWDDREAVQEVLQKKLLDGEFSKFRVREGTF